MTDKRITELTELLAVSVDDMLAIVDDPAGTPVTKKVTVANLLAGATGTTPTLAAVLAVGNDPGGHEIRAAAGAQSAGAALLINPDPTTGAGANAIMGAGNGATGQNGGIADISGGSNVDGATGGYIDAIGARAAGSGGGIEIGSGQAASGSGGDGGDLTFFPGSGDGAGRTGLVFLNLPTGDPGVSGALYVDGGGFVKVSP